VTGGREPGEKANLLRIMAVRRALVSAPLAVVVALLAHTARFGSSHAFGGPQGHFLIAAALAGLALLALLGPLVLGLAPARRRATPMESAGLILNLALGGAAVYSGMEWLEGHAPALVGGTWVALGLSALLVALVALLAALGLRRLGLAIAATLPVLARCGRRGSETLRWALPPFQLRLLPRASRGRAPPLPT
jgi:hypothetical protein